MTLQVKLVAAVGALAVAAAAGAAAVILSGRSTAGPATVPVPSQPDFPAPPLGAVVFSRELGAHALALGVVPQPGRVLLQASVLGPEGTGVGGLTISFSVQGASKGASACGAGCYWATLPTAGRPRAVEVDVRGGPSARWHVALPASWPPPPGGALIARAGRVWRSLHSLSFHELLASDSRHAIRSTWRVQAPDRIAYEVRHGSAAVVVGGRRWDRAPGTKRWVASGQTPLTQPVPFWVSSADAHVLGTATVRGRPVWRISFFDPVTPAWFTVAVDRRTFHTLDLRMITTSHFMHDVYGSFDEAPPIRPPR